MSQRSQKESSPFPRTYKEGPFGTVHGGAVGRVWETGREIEIDVEGLKVVAGLLEGEAPRTCEAFLSILPFEGEVLPLRWSGDGFQTHHPRIERMAEDSELVMENFSVLAARGDISFWVRDRGVFFCYNYMYSRGITGEEPGNLFAHVRPEYYAQLYEIGRSVYTGGKKAIRITLIE